MLSYEVNKNVSVSQKSNGSPYQFEQQGKVSQKKLFLIGDFEKHQLDELTELDYKTKVIDSIEEALSLLQENILSSAKLPDAIITNLNLSDGDAFELHSLVKQDNFLRTLPFIVIAPEMDAETVKKARQSGVDDFYTIPVNAEDLHNRINFLTQYKTEKSKITISNDLVFRHKISLLKRSFDILLSGMALLVLSPILLLVAILIKLESKGPIVYVSKRVGTGYNVFDLYKFRSMKTGADVELKKLMHLNQYGENDKTNGAFVKLDNDPRVTKFGKFLRASSIDEIPQLLNVLKGDMSLVGNRPLPLYEAEQLTRDGWAKRFLAPAGLTGLWQVSRRGQEEMSVPERVILDNTYADRHSFWLDMKIILQTFPALFSKIQS